MSRESGNGERAHGGESQLARLQEHERALAERLADARADADLIVDRARADAERAKAELEASLEEEAEGLREEIRSELRTSLERISAEARERAERFERVPDDRIAELVELTFARLVGAGDRP